MKRLPTEKRVAIVRCLVEGCSIASAVRMTGLSKKTVAKLLAELGNACREWHDQNVWGLKSRRVQVDKVWSFVGAKQKKVDKGAAGLICPGLKRRYNLDA